MAVARVKRTSHSKLVKSKQSYNVIVAGESGTGKSAVINMIFDCDAIQTSSSAVGCTNKCTLFLDSPKGYPHLQLRMIDTVGLCESLEGTVPNEQALKLLENELDSLYSNEGIHLILFCIKQGRQSEGTSHHFQTIVRDLCENQVPCILVITHCEDDAPLGEWLKENEVFLRKRLNFDVIHAASVTTVRSEETTDVYKESRKRIIEAIEKHALKNPWRVKNVGDKLRSFFKKTILRTSNIQPKKSDPVKDNLLRPMDAAPTPKKSTWLSFWS